MRRYIFHTFMNPMHRLPLLLHDLATLDGLRIYLGC
jgi:hypothetical protein